MHTRRNAPVLVALLVAAAVLASGCSSPSSPAQDVRQPDAPALRLAPVVEGLAQPVYATSAPGDGRLFVAEQAGRIMVADAGGRLTFLDVRDRVTAGGEQGFLGFAFHPDYATSGRLVLHYTDDTRDTHVAEHVRRTRDSADPEGRTLLTVDDPYSNHNGGMVAFGPDGKLYVALGDGGAGGDPQRNALDKDSLLGKLLRLEPGGGPAAGNPFLGTDGADEVWALGLRNPWRFSFDRATGDLWIGDVGQNRWEEIDLLPAGSPGGASFGWSAYEGHHLFNDDVEDPDAIAPVWEYANGDGRCAVTGGYVYRGQAIPALVGTYVYADYCGGNVWGLRQQADGTWANTLLLETGLNPSSFGEDADGELLLVDHGTPQRPGSVQRIVTA